MLNLDRYLKELSDVKFLFQYPDAKSSWHLFVIKVSNRKRMYEHLKSEGIMTQVHYIPVKSHPFYNNKKLDNSAIFYRDCLNLPVYYDLTDEDQTMIINFILEEKNEL